MKRVLFLTSFHPYAEGEIGAGEKICGDSLSRLINDGYCVDVIVICPSRQRACNLIRAKCNDYAVFNAGFVSTVKAIVKNIKNGSLLSPWHFTRVSPELVKEVQERIAKYSYEFIWIDFPSSLGFVNYIEHEDIRYFVHDVVLQRIERSLIKRMLKRFVCRVEASLFSKINKMSVLSEKDEKIIREMGFNSFIEVIQLGYQEVGVVDNAVRVESIVDAFSNNLNIVFFGNMKRAENHWSIIWFILFVFMRLFFKKNDLHLWILGIRPRWLLRLIGKMIPRIHVVGAVDNPVPAFKNAALCIAPLLFGAGVKIKVIQMLDAGGRVLATPVGAEGVAENERLMVFPSSEIYKAMLQEVDKCCHFH